MDTVSALATFGGVVAAVAGIATIARATFNPRSRIWLPLISRGSTAHPPRVALTFDDGPSPGPTETILDILRDEGVPAAFFVIGRNVAAAPHLLKRMHAEGHLIGNHTYDHAHWGGFSGAEYWDQQIGKTDDLIEQLIGVRCAMFRPPLGIKTFWLNGVLKHHHQTMVTWSLKARDGVTTTVDDILARLLPTASAGDIMLLHDGFDPHSPRDPQPSIDCLRPLIRSLREKGFEIVRLDDLIDVEAYANARSQA
jgi:peptidoglycan/xylan/chitin deacetylase (PgdA/CDA1 family)